MHMISVGQGEDDTKTILNTTERAPSNHVITHAKQRVGNTRRGHVNSFVAAQSRAADAAYLHQQVMFSASTRLLSHEDEGVHK